MATLLHLVLFYAEDCNLNVLMLLFTYKDSSPNTSELLAQ